MPLLSSCLPSHFHAVSVELYGMKRVKLFVAEFLRIQLDSDRKLAYYQYNASAW
jgi:hypothetical protein